VFRSSLYLTAPQGPVRDQPPFLNAVVAFGRGSEVEPVDVLRDLLTIEAALGRDRAHEVPLGPRPIDLDLLLCGERVCRCAGPPATEVPHPRLAERAFALEPLAEVAGYDLGLPGIGATVGQRLADPMVRAQPVSRLPGGW
jgi:2-amino-4-hydroxy-6-hydroxymethyldihydropteridine diphosphokinase